MQKYREAVWTAWHKKVSDMDMAYDPQLGLVCEQVKGINYHTAISSGTVHRTRENFEYLVALYQRGGNVNIQKAERILQLLLPLQDANPERATYGIWPYLWEEPLEQMKNPDWNWAPFIARILLCVMLEFPEALTGERRKQMLRAVRRACECIRLRKMGVDYTNISLMSSFVMVCGGEALEEGAFVAWGVDMLERQLAFLTQNGGFAEYNSPYYGVLDIEETGRCLRYIQNPRARKTAAALHRACWEVFAKHFHSGTRQIAPPHARCYADIQDPRIATLIQMGLGDSCQVISKDEMDMDLLWPFIDLDCPEELKPCFAPQDHARAVTDNFYKGFDPIANEEARVLLEKGMPPVTAYTWLAPDYCLGSFDNHDLWNQRRPLMGYFRTQTGVACLRLRCFHDDMDYSSAIVQTIQLENAATGAVRFVTDHGDYHYILTPLQDGCITANRFFLEFSLQGAAAVERLEGDSFRFCLSGQQVYLRILHAVFGRFPVETETYAQAGDCGVRIWLTRGENTKIDFTALGQAAIAYWLEVCPKGETPQSSVGAEETGGKLHLTLKNRDAEKRVEVTKEITRYCTAVPGLEKRYRKGGFYYVPMGGIDE